MLKAVKHTSSLTLVYRFGFIRFFIVMAHEIKTIQNVKVDIAFLHVYITIGK